MAQGQKQTEKRKERIMLNVPTAATIINQFWNQTTPGGQPWTPTLIVEVYGFDAQSVNELWAWCQQQAPNMSAGQLLALFNSSEQMIATPMGEEILPAALPQPSTAAIGTISEQQLFSDLYSFLHGKNPSVFP